LALASERGLIVVRVGLFTDSLEHLTLDELLTWLEQELPMVRDLEIGTGGYSPTPHCDLGALLASEAERARWLESLTSRGFRLAALNVSGNPLEIEQHDRDLRGTIELAGRLGVDRIVCMSGGSAALSGGGWFPRIEERIEEYWLDVLLPYWEDVAAVAAGQAGLRLCFELEPGAAVYNVSTFERVAALGTALAVNLDPSHLFWQSMDTLAVVRRFGGRIAFAHAKDTVVDPERVVLDGSLDRHSWRFATVGDGHGVEWWRAFAGELRDAGYDDVLSIEYEDPTHPPESSVTAAANVLSDAIAAGGAG
jgi:sugar phosphate isomerase/epimerase